MMTYKSFVEVWLNTCASLPVPPVATGEEMDLRLVEDLIRRVELKSRDVFYVLGSGIGTVRARLSSPFPSPAHVSLV
jgi:hypothetical protein